MRAASSRHHPGVGTGIALRTPLREPLRSHQLFPLNVAVKPLDMLANADCPASRPVTVLSLIVAEPVGAGKKGGAMTMPSSPGASMTVFSNTIPVDVENVTP